MPDGYIRTKPDISWWLDQIYRGIKYRETFTHEHKWNIWRDYYRGNWRKGVLPLNLFYIMLRTTVPRIYFRNPTVSISPKMPGLETAVTAQVLQRVDNKLIAQMGLKDEMKRAIQNAWMFGVGDLKLGFGAQYTPTPEFGSTGEPLRAGGERLEYRDNVFVDMPWVSSVHTGNLIVPDGVAVKADARWIAEWIRRPVDDVRRDERLKNNKDLGPTSLRSSVTSRTPHRTHRHISSAEEDMVDLLEIRDKKFDNVMILAPLSNTDGRELFNGPDAFLNNGAFNHFPIVFNADDEVFWGVPDSHILEPHQLEINETKTQQMKHRRLSIVKAFAKEDAIDEEELLKMTDEEVMAVVRMNGNPNTDISIKQTGGIPRELFESEALTMQNVRETLGFSRNQFGEFNSRSGDTTATEANIVQMASEIRVDERRDIVADRLVEIIQGMHSIIFNHWSQEQVIDVVGPGGIPVWVRFTGAEARKLQFNVSVDPDETVPETKQLRQQRALEMYEVLKANPLIDPIKLTQYLLTEIPGVQFDDLMKALPPPEQNSSGPVSIQEFGNLTQQQLQQAQQNPSQLQLVQGGQ